MLPWEDASSAGPGRFHSTLMFGQFFFFCVCVCLSLTCICLPGRAWLY